MNRLMGAATLLMALVLFTQCKDDDSTSPNGNMRIEITDGPIDDASVKGAFITVTAVEVDGQEISGFSKQTIDLMAYQNGDTKLLGSLDLEAGTYNDITLVLDHAQDANGNSPGSYVLTTDNVKHNLNATASSTLTLTHQANDIQVEDEGTTNVVLDFDLRKAIRYEDSPQAGDQFDFVTNAELGNAIRLVAKAETGKVTGSAKDNLGIAGDKIVVYAYAKGDYNKSTEMSGQGASSIQFQNAVTSAVANDQGNFTLAFLEAGDYELHFFGYEDNNDDGKMELKGELQVNLLANLGLDLNQLSIGANENLSVSVGVIGLLP